MNIVILAGGRGTRLGAVEPKSLIELDSGHTVLEYQLRKLMEEVPAAEISLVVGHLADRIQDKYPELNYFMNADYMNTGPAKGLLCAVRELPQDEDIMWLSGDLYFDDGVLSLLMQEQASAAIVTKTIYNDDDVKFKVNPEFGAITELSKQMTKAEAAGCLPGIVKIAAKEVPALRDSLEAMAPKAYFIDGMNHLIQTHGVQIKPVDIGELFCHDIDYKQDLEEVIAHVR